MAKYGYDEEANIYWCPPAEARRKNKAHSPTVRMLSPAGATTDVTYTCGAGDRSLESSYAIDAIRRKERAGFLDIRYCPAATLEVIGQEPCSDRVDSRGRAVAGPVSMCEHMQAIADERYAKHIKSQMRHAGRQAEKEARESTDAQIQQMAASIDKLANTFAKPKRGSQKEE